MRLLRGEQELEQKIDQLAQQIVQLEDDGPDPE